MNKNLFILLLLGVFFNFSLAATTSTKKTSTHTTTKTSLTTTKKTSTHTTTSTITKGVLIKTVINDIYAYTTLKNTLSGSVVTRKSATSAKPITSAVTSTTKAKTSSVLPTSSAKTTTSVVFSSKASVTSTTLKASSASSVSQNTSNNPLVTSKIVVSTSNSASINTKSLTKGTTLTTSGVAASKTSSSSKAFTVTTKTTSSSKSSSSTKATTSTKSSSSTKATTSSKSSSKATTTTKSSSSTKATTTSKTSSSTKATTSSTSKKTSSTSSVAATSTAYSGDLFSVIDTSAPPSVFTREAMYITPASGVDNGASPYQTNKFYVNMMLDYQNDQAFVYPYSVWWRRDTYYGFAVSHTTSSQYAYGTHTWDSGANGYYYNPLNISQLVFSATKFTSSSVSFKLTKMKELSALATLSLSGSTTNYIDFPMVEGMGFVTGIYHGSLIPQLNSQAAILSLVKESSSNLATGILKYRASLNNGVDWLIYVTLPSGYTSSQFKLTVSNSVITGSAAIDGLIMQVAVAPSSTTSEVYYDQAAGMYVTSAAVSGSVSNGKSAEYLITYQTSGSSLSGTAILFLLPHHVDSLSSSFSGTATGFYLDSTTKGKMYAYLTTQIIMAETLETDMQFLPWISGMTKLSYTASQLELIATAANSELSVNIADTVASVDSNYYSGKVIDKYAYILLTVSEIIGDAATTKATITQMKAAFAPFILNTQYYPLIYDTRYKGVTSSASQTSKDSGLDFGATLYNDHHFHYGYFVHAAAVLGYVDAKNGGTWAKDNKAWVNSLIRDVANPSSSDTYFPVSRMFNFFQGHSWASGLAVGGDGRNQESSSEDYNFAYGMKLWGKVIGDHSMESRGDLMLAISKRAMNKYYLYSSDNTVEPSTIIPNKVAGILFDNKIDYTTYFGSNLEYIHGIHMLPITPASSLVRGATFAKQEWSSKLSSIVGSLTSGWAGVLRLNQALFDASTSYNFFSSSSFSSSYLDNGQSKTWCLAFSAGVMNSS